MKKMLGLLLCCLLLSGFAACGKNSDKGTQDASSGFGDVVNDNYGDWIDDIGD